MIFRDIPPRWGIIPDQYLKYILSKLPLAWWLPSCRTNSSHAIEKAVVQKRLGEKFSLKNIWKNQQTYTRWDAGFVKLYFITDAEFLRAFLDHITKGIQVDHK